MRYPAYDTPIIKQIASKFGCIMSLESIFSIIYLIRFEEGTISNALIHKEITWLNHNNNGNNVLLNPTIN